MQPNFQSGSLNPPPRISKRKDEDREIPLGSSWFEPRTEPTIPKRDPPADGETGGISKAVSEGVHKIARSAVVNTSRTRGR